MGAAMGVMVEVFDSNGNLIEKNYTRATSFVDLVRQGCDPEDRYWIPFDDMAYKIISVEQFPTPQNGANGLVRIKRSAGLN